LLSELTDDPRPDAASKLKYLMSSQPRRIAGCFFKPLRNLLHRAAALRRTSRRD
jgi:hypothetical protein